MSTLLAVLLAFASQDPAPSAPSSAPRPPASGPRAVLVAADGSESTVALDAWTVAEPRAFTASLVRFEPGGAEPVARADAAELELASGELLVGEVAGGQDERLAIRVSGGLEVGADLERIRALRFPRRLAGAAGVEPAAEGDRLFRLQSSGVERIDGAVEGFTEGGVRFHGALVGTIAVPWRNVAALFVEHAGAKPPKRAADAVPVSVDLDDGSRVAGLLLAIRDRAVAIDRRGETLRIPLAAVLQIARDDGTIAFLSGLPPKSAEASRPFGDDLGMVWPPRFDRNVGGGALQSGGTRHPRGIGVHAPSRTTWALDGTFATLRGSVALDDEVQKLATRGSCMFRVLLDGREAWASKVVRAGEPPVAFAVDLGGARELALVVDTTDDGFAGDRANWLGLVLARR